MKPWFKPAAAALILPLVLTACLFLPGKFESTLDIRADRSFTFTYKGEVLAADLDGMGDMFKGTGEPGKSDEAKSEDGAEVAEAASDGPVDAAEEAKKAAEETKEAAEKKAKKEADYRELAVQLAKEAGYKTVEYRGEGKFYVDYAISGVLTHNFVYPYDLDTAMIFPWVAIELRGKDTLRMKAPGFAKQDNAGSMGMNGVGGAESKLDGTFTLTTDAEVLSQNDESGGTSAGGKRVFKWRITPRVEDAPLAVLKVKSL